jgi:hypothetical protein
MKKLAILFLLTSLLAVSAFAIEGVGDFTASLAIDFTDVGEAEGPRGLTIKPAIEFERDLVENLRLYIGVGVPFATALEDIDFVTSLDSFEVKLSYGGIVAGPGNLGFFLDNVLKVGDFSDAGDTLGDGITVGVTYGGIVAGPGSLGFELGGDMGIVAGGEVDFVFKDVYLSAAYALDAGVTVTLKPYLMTDPDVEFGGLYAKVGYASDVFGAGVEIDRFPDDFKGFPLDVYGEAYLLGNALTLRAHITLANIAADAGDIGITPGVKVSYKF